MGARKDRGLHSSSSKSKRFADLAAPESTIDDFVEKTKEIGEVDPKPAVKTAGIEAPIHERVVSLNHHEPFTLETIHFLELVFGLSNTLHHQRQTTGQKSTAKNCGGERHVRARTAAGMRTVQQIAHASLNHQNGEGQECAHSEPP
jgi:hypothetical protein